MQNQSQTTHQRFSRILLAACVLILGSFVGVKAAADDFPDLGAATNFAVLGFGGKISITGPSSVMGDIGVAAPASFSQSGPSRVFGDIVRGGALVDQAVADALAASDAAQSLDATDPTSVIHHPTTIFGDSGVNVLNLTDLVLTKGALTLNAPGDGAFVINVTGRFSLSGGSKILIDGGLMANNVLINIVGPGQQVAFNGGTQGGVPKAQICGTLIAAERDIALSPGQVNGRVIGGRKISITSGGRVNMFVD